jgi:hypothetical protein
MWGMHGLRCGARRLQVGGSGCSAMPCRVHCTRCSICVAQRQHGSSSGAASPWEGRAAPPHNDQPLVAAAMQDPVKIDLQCAAATLVAACCRSSWPITQQLLQGKGTQALAHLLPEAPLAPVPPVPGAAVPPLPGAADGSTQPSSSGAGGSQPASGSRPSSAPSADAAVGVGDEAQAPVYRAPPVKVQSPELQVRAGIQCPCCPLWVVDVSSERSCWQQCPDETTGCRKADSARAVDCPPFLSRRLGCLR